MKTILNGLAACGAALALALSAGATHAGTLTLYTSQPEADATRTVEAFKAANPGVEVEIFRSGTSDLLTKLAAEFAAGAPQPDVLLIADAVTMELLKKDGRLLPYAEADVEGLAADSYDAARTYFGSKLITTGIAYNTAAAEKPQHWADLVKPQYKDGVVMPSPLYSGAAAYMMSGVALDPALGWDFYAGLKANEAITVRGNGAVLKAVAGGEKPYGILVDFMALNARAQGSPVEFVFPSEGVTAVTEPVAILSTARNVEDGKRFVDFILSDEGQKLARDMGYLPAKASAGRPDWLPEGVEVKLMPVDIGAVVERIEADKARFAELFGG
ncbi:MAG: Fe(3+) ABC transporter substrate-binding protein [Hyphomicrobiales bacterium]|nr:MAG: Fe(3+) ABC transporter substrate-binding protein [Hyphomicrobiales bacterium]